MRVGKRHTGVVGVFPFILHYHPHIHLLINAHLNDGEPGDTNTKGIWVKQQQPTLNYIIPVYLVGQTLCLKLGLTQKGVYTVLGYV